MAIAAEFDLEILQYDVVGAFLNALISSSSTVLCDLPDGYRKEGKCARLRRALYGLRESPLMWYKELSTSLERLGLTASKEEPCLFYNNDRSIFILFYVDDILLMFKKAQEQEAMELIEQLSEMYELDERGEVEWFLGVRVIRDRSNRTITLIQDNYIDKIAKRFDLHNTGRFPKVPLLSEELEKYEGEASKREIKDYQERVGSILYAAITLRPDVAFAASTLSRFLTNPSSKHLQAADQVIVYLYRTRFEGIRYGIYSISELTIYGDASFADDPVTRRSSYGYIITLFGGAIIWKAARQETVTTSTTEAELLALEHVAKESMALKRLFKELTLQLNTTWEIYCDNQQTIRLVVGENERITTRLRHVDIRNMWLRQEHAKGSFQVTYLPTKEMPADGLTKYLPGLQFQRFKELINIQSAESQIKAIEIGAQARARPY